MANSPAAAVAECDWLSQQQSNIREGESMRSQPAIDASVRFAIRRVVLVGVALLVSVGVAGPSPASAQVVTRTVTPARVMRAFLGA